MTLSDLARFQRIRDQLNHVDSWTLTAADLAMIIDSHDQLHRLLMEAADTIHDPSFNRRCHAAMYGIPNVETQ
jgi:hypothetical protein